MSQFQVIESIKVTNPEIGYIDWAEDEVQKDLFVIIPSAIMYDPNLIDGSKLLMGEIYALSHRWGYCIASNTFFAKKFKKDDTTISKWISCLKKNGYIISGTQNRRIYPSIKTKGLYNASLNKIKGGCENTKSLDLNQGTLNIIKAPCENAKHNSKSNSTSNNKINNKPKRSDQVGSSLCDLNAKEITPLDLIEDQSLDQSFQDDHLSIRDQQIPPAAPSADPTKLAFSEGGRTVDSPDVPVGVITPVMMDKMPNPSFSLSSENFESYNKEWLAKNRAFKLATDSASYKMQQPTLAEFWFECFCIYPDCDNRPIKVYKDWDSKGWMNSGRRGTNPVKFWQPLISTFVRNWIKDDKKDTKGTKKSKKQNNGNQSLIKFLSGEENTNKGKVVIPLSWWNKYKCPACDTVIHDRATQSCPQCGATLDWSEWNEIIDKKVTTA